MTSKTQSFFTKQNVVALEEIHSLFEVVFWNAKSTFGRSIPNIGIISFLISAFNLLCFRYEDDYMEKMDR